LDTSKWKSVLLALDTYKALKQIAEIEKRTISGQFTFIFEKYCEEAGYEIIKKDNTSKPSKKRIELD
jgi:hypothetical protein